MNILGTQTGVGGAWCGKNDNNGEQRPSNCSRLVEGSMTVSSLAAGNFVDEVSDLARSIATALDE